MQSRSFIIFANMQTFFIFHHNISLVQINRNPLGNFLLHFGLFFKAKSFKLFFRHTNESDTCECKVMENSRKLLSKRKVFSSTVYWGHIEVFITTFSYCYKLIEMFLSISLFFFIFWICLFIIWNFSGKMCFSTICDDSFA
jgi:hypothetical protein